MSLRITLRMYQFTLELLLGILLLFFSVIGEKEPIPIGMLLALSFGAFLLFSFMLEKFAGKGRWASLYIVSLLFLTVGIFAGLPILHVSLLGLFIFWRGIAPHDPADQREIQILLFSFLIGVPLLLSASIIDSPFRNQIVTILLFQLLLVFIGGFYKKWVCIRDDNFEFAMFFVKLCGVLFSTAGLITLFMKYIESSLTGILKYTAMLFGVAALPILNLLKNLHLAKQPTRENQQPNQTISDLLKEADAAKNYSFFMTKDFFLLSFLVIGLICLGFFFFKRRRELSIPWLGKSPATHISEIINEPTIRVFSGKHVPSEDFIRKEIFRFEIYAQKLHNGRYPFETLEEWFVRIGLTGREQLISIYERTRYGEIVSSHEEQLQVKNEISQMKQQLYSRKGL